MTIKREVIEAKALELLKTVPQGLRTSQLLKALQENLPDMHPKTINGIIWLLAEKRPEEVYKPERGLFRHVSFKEK